MHEHSANTNRDGIDLPAVACLIAQPEFAKGRAVKKSYEKPVLLRRDALSKVTAVPPQSIAIVK